MARFKIYYRSRQTSFDSVVANLALGGLSKLPPSALADLKHLWHLILDTLDVEYDSNTCTPLPAIDHETAGMLYDAAIRLGDPVPVTKVYIPVRHYGRQSDGAVMDGLVEWLRESGSDVFGGIMSRP
ncbi:aromatic prenyltransferase [Bombardia bombarda]|uniref:Aromatic prenyltransferase n=1 Tax=Bombardia bombarda TaxID=252184 RepID=A0AA39WGV6_9PEZI|nr:aromatic prenyltransferase [Bombardia bombarda]